MDTANLDKYIVKEYKDVIFIEPHAQYLHEGIMTWKELYVPSKNILKKIELCGRVCYKSEDKITNDSSNRFVKMIKNTGHHSVLEHITITVKFVGSRDMSHQLVRHRLSNFSQESQRFCNYGKLEKLYAIVPPDIYFNKEQLSIFRKSIVNDYNTYKSLLKLGVKPEKARYALPGATKTEVVATFNLRQWMHVLNIRISEESDWEIKSICYKILGQFQSQLPEIFGDII